MIPAQSSLTFPLRVHPFVIPLAFFCEQAQSMSASAPLKNEKKNVGRLSFGHQGLYVRRKRDGPFNWVLPPALQEGFFPPSLHALSEKYIIDA
jgi:hypothetical protein